jgi:hypothetical protein
MGFHLGRIISGLANQAMDAVSASYITIVLVILGLVVGVLNIKDKEIFNFLIATIAIVAVGAANLNQIPIIGSYLGYMVLNIVAFVAPAALVVALKAIYGLASNKS